MFRQMLCRYPVHQKQIIKLIDPLSFYRGVYDMFGMLEAINLPSSSRTGSLARQTGEMVCPELARIYQGWLFITLHGSRYESTTARSRSRIPFYRQKARDLYFQHMFPWISSINCFQPGKLTKGRAIKVPDSHSSITAQVLGEQDWDALDEMGFSEMSRNHKPPACRS